MISHRYAVAVSLFTAFALPCAAMAADEPPVVQLLLKTIERQTKVKPVYEDIATDSDGDVTITGLNATIPVEGAAAGGLKYSIASIQLEAISDQGNGLWEIGSATYSEMKLSFAGPEGVAFSVDVPRLAMEGWYLKDAGANPTPIQIVRSSLTTAKRAASGKIAVNAVGHSFTADGYEVTWDGDPVTGSGKTSFKVSNVVVPEAALASIDPTGQMKALGYASLAFDIGGAGSLMLGDDELGFDGDIFYAGRDMGTLKLGAAAAKIPAAVLAELQKSEPGKEPNLTALMPQLTGIEIGRLVVRFEDASLVSKLLPVVARMQGMDVQTMIANAGAMMQLGLAQLKNPAFTEKAVAAVTAFLKDPKSITLSVQPAAPVAVQQLMALDPANPGAAVDRLGVTLTAND